MVSIFSWLRKEIAYLIKSLPDIFRGLLFFLLASSGLVCALLLRYFDFNGTFISAVSIIVEALSLLLCYYIFKGYFTPEEEIKATPSKKVKRR